jgi:hypothetical protein
VTVLLDPHLAWPSRATSSCTRSTAPVSSHRRFGRAGEEGRGCALTGADGTSSMSIFFVCVILIFRDGGSELDQVHAYLVSTYALFFSVFPVQRSTLVATIAYRFFRELTTFRVYAALANLIATTFAILYMLRGSAVSVFLRETLLELFFLFF